MISIIVAMSRNGVIGKDNDIPWKLPSDLRRFRETTQGHVIVMGRRTWESLPRAPLPNRENVVISRTLESLNGATVCASLEQALAELPKDKDIFIIGGEQIYRLGVTCADQLIVTVIHEDIEGDTYFPQINSLDWALVSEENVTDDSLPYSVLTFRRS